MVPTLIILPRHDSHKDYSFESLSILGTCREAVEDNLTLLEEAGFSIEYTENDYQVSSFKKWWKTWTCVKKCCAFF